VAAGPLLRGKCVIVDWFDDRGAWQIVAARVTSEDEMRCEVEVAVPRGAWYSGTVGGQRPSEATPLTFINRRAIVQVPHGGCVIRLTVEGPEGAPWEVRVVPRHHGAELPEITRGGTLGKERIVASRLAVSA